MKIVQIIDKLVVGGAQKLLVTFAREVRDRDIDLTVVVLWDGARQSIVDELISYGAKVEIIPANRSTDLSRLLRLVRYFRKQRFDVICTHLFQAGILGVLLGRITNTPVISTLHNVSKPTGYFRSRIWQTMLCRGSDLVVAVGHSVADAHNDWLSDINHYVLPNPVGSIEQSLPAAITSMRTSIMGNPGDTLILSVGIVSPQKAYQDLIEAMKPICAENDQVFLAIAGGGRPHNVAIVKKQIDDLGLVDRVVLLGMRDDIPLLLSAADLFVTSSHWEGLPVAVLEAMSAGLPVVATSVGDIPRVVVEGTGLLVPAKKPELLSDAILKLVNDPGCRVRFGHAAKDYVARHHAPDKWADKQLQLISQTISERI